MAILEPCIQAARENNGAKNITAQNKYRSFCDFWACGENVVPREKKYRRKIKIPQFLEFWGSLRKKCTP
jgi:hypothetical protein